MNNESAATTKMMNEFYGIETPARPAALTALVNAAQDKFAVVSFRTVPRGAFKWAHGGRRGYYRLQTNLINCALPINSKYCINQVSGPTGLETAGKRSSYCLDESRESFLAKAKSLNKTYASDKWANSMSLFSAYMLTKSLDADISK